MGEEDEKEWVGRGRVGEWVGREREGEGWGREMRVGRGMGRLGSG